MRATYPPSEVRACAATVSAPPPLYEWATTHLAHYFTLPPSRFHEWLARELSAFHRKRSSRLNVLAPRGAAKSTWSTLAYPLYAALHGLEPYVVITSDTGDQAREFLASIRQELEGERLIAAYPHAAGQGKVWKENRIVLRNGVKIEALGTGAKMRGRKNRQHRPSLIIVDDPQNTDHMLSALRRERSWNWLVKDVMNAGDQNTNVVVLGTALHRDGIVNRLQRTAGWTSRVFQAIIKWPARMDLWRIWETYLNDWDNVDREQAARAFFEKHRKEMER